VLRELRLLLRLMRFKRLDAEYAAGVAALCGLESMAAVE
jgi:hypothetical protein